VISFNDLPTYKKSNSSPSLKKGEPVPPELEVPGVVGQAKTKMFSYSFIPSP